MMKNKLIITATCVFVMLCSLSFAQQAASVKTEDKVDYLAGLSAIDTAGQRLKEAFRKNKTDINFSAGILQGYDNNVNLDPARKKDGFLQTSATTELIYNYTDDIRLRVGNDTTDILYYNVNNANLVDVYNNIGMELDLGGDMFTVGSDYVFDAVIFPNDPDGTYLGNQVNIFAEQRITENLFHEATYFFLYKDFSHDTTRDTAGTKTNDKRRDFRNGLNYRVGAYLFDKLLLRTDIQFYRNDGNYQFFDFYDYWSFLIRPSCVLLITDKLYASASYTYQQRPYDDRLSSDTGAHVYDETNSFNLSVMYDLSKSFTLAFNYSYRENSSNEPLQRYSGSIMTGGLYYSF